MNSNVSVVIPNYNGQRLLEKHLPAVFQMLQDQDQVVIVDDASTDDSVQWLQHKYHLTPFNDVPVVSLGHENEVEIFQEIYSLTHKKIEIIVVRNLKNVRFAQSCNRGVQYARHPYVFLLNSDVKPHRYVLHHLLAHFKDKNVFAVGCLEQEGVEENLKFGRPLRLSGKNKLWFEKGIFFHSRARDLKTGTTAWVSGGSGLFDREKWLELGGFDLDYAPAYWEDIDLSFRARQKGWRILFESLAIVDHNHETTNRTAFGQRKIAEMSWRNADKFVKKNGTFWQHVSYYMWRPYWWWKRRQVRK
jgi:GT2 family glycosyltransferase